MTSVQLDAPRAAVDARSLVAAYWTPRRAVWLMAALGVVLRGWVAAAGFFYGDDYVFQGRAWQLPLDLDYLLHPYDGHLMPGGFALQWGVTRQWPMNAVPLAVVETLGQALVIALFARFALRLWGARWLVLVPVTVVAVTPLTLPSSTWWASAITFLPLQLALVLTLGAALSWSRTGRQRHLWGGFLVWLPLLTFSEKVVLVPWVVLAAVSLLDPSRSSVRAWARALRAAPLVWASYAVVTGGYVWLYVHTVVQRPDAQPTAAQVADLVGRGTVMSGVPALLGGPLVWEPTGNGSAIGQPPVWLVVVAAELLLLLVVVSVATSAQARRAWVWAGVFVIGDLALLTFSRLAPFVDPVIVQGLRDIADAAIPTAVAVGVALAAVAPGARRAVVTWGVRPGYAGRVTRTAIVALCAVMAVLSIVSTARFREIWRANWSAVYVGNAAHDLAAAQAGPPVIDQPVPDTVLSGLMFPYNQVSWLLAPLQVRPAFDDPTTRLRVLDGAGYLVPGIVVGPAARPGPIRGCGWFVHGGSGTIPLQTSTVNFSHAVRVAYLASGNGSATIALGDGPARRIDLTKGTGEVTLTLVGGGDQLRFTRLTPGVGFCTDDVHVGVVAPAAP